MPYDPSGPTSSSSVCYRFPHIVKLCLFGVEARVKGLGPEGGSLRNGMCAFIGRGQTAVLCNPEEGLTEPWPSHLGFPSHGDHKV